MKMIAKQKPGRRRHLALVVAVLGLAPSVPGYAAWEDPGETDASKQEAKDKLEPPAPVAAPTDSADADAKAPLNVSGGVEVVSLYAQRGITAAEDSTTLALQPYVNFAFPWGIYLGYWGSTTTYGRDPSPAGGSTPRTIEHDFAAGWSADVGPGKVRVGVTYYLYQHYDGADVPESDLAFELAPKWGANELGTVRVSVQTMLADCDWGNSGDTYALVHYDYDRAGKWNFALDVGFQSYESTTNLSAEESLSLRNVDVTVARSVAETGFSLRLTAMLGGLDRNGVRQPMRLIWGAGWSFE